MKAINIQCVGSTRISVAAISRGAEYSVKLPVRRVAMPVYEMTSEPKSDRRYFQEGVAL